ncbi:hypothetical protein FEM48_Zijuj03G0061600 [Ziziphus jujuba var. spinosa]|uniref:C2H2-type domain-containing protein n=1 Tax=Ziziphus jujuba var. spinosa TaxID=714518 RepID=A0A978VNM7_ZIZJJ|nr:hypothetical protein FEM48_Zijuj03G0061600 [Ziziphus jujuba var. spinosa]
MEEEAHHKYWIWMMKRKQNDDNPLMNYSSLSGTSSWDDKAFTQEYSSSATRCVEGYIWPPRSYSCSFCMREFRSAQALGGHMNVHRRDRAMLKQSILDSKLGSERNLREEEDLMWLGRDNDDDDDDDNHVETDLCVGLNSVVGRNYKRTKMAMPPPPPLPFFIKHCHLQSEVIELKVGSSMEDLDLELRLGDSPNVN